MQQIMPQNCHQYFKLIALYILFTILMISFKKWHTKNIKTNANIQIVFRCPRGIRFLHNTI